MEGEEIAASIGSAFWIRYELKTTRLSQELAEQLRLIMEPTLTSKLQGDYKTGKRINMKKIFKRKFKELKLILSLRCGKLHVRSAADFMKDELLRAHVEALQSCLSDGKSDEQPMLHNSETKIKASAETSFETTFIQSFLDTLTKHNPSISTSNSNGPVSSLIICMLPNSGQCLYKDIILFRPLLLLLVTNIIIVVAPLLLEKVKQIERKGSSSCNAGFGDNIVGDCEIRSTRKSCKKCSCGRAEAEEMVKKLGVTTRQLENPHVAS
uniref:Midasin isoform X12 n=1 Tax=Tanacetum cinerariifolium TaxID=118510 RepID=A0A699HLP1_TANCI|nr:midasin isoform X12 [Tanacetum cinerariifolium]